MLLNKHTRELSTSLKKMGLNFFLISHEELMCTTKWCFTHKPPFFNATYDEYLKKNDNLVQY